jgi:hypothetical protein
MRRVLVVEQYDNAAEAMAAELGCTEIASGVPRFEGYVQVLPSVVIESGTNPGLVLGAFNARKTSKDELDALQDLPAPAAPARVNSFLLAVMSLLSLSVANTLASKYPVFTIALNAGNWSAALDALKLAASNSDLTSDQYNSIITLAAQYAIPFSEKSGG